MKSLVKSLVVFFLVITSVEFSFSQLHTPNITFPTCGRSTSVALPVVVNWDDVDGAYRYRVEISESNGAWTENSGFEVGNTINSIQVYNSELTWSEGKVGTQYFVTIQALNQDNTVVSQYCDVCSFTTTVTPCSLSTPAGFEVEVISKYQIKLSWQAVIGAVENYRIYDRGSFIDPPTTDNYFYHSNLTPESSHCYRVAACCNPANCSPLTDEICVKATDNTGFKIEGRTVDQSNIAIGYSTVTFTGNNGNANLQSVNCNSDGAYSQDDVPAGWTGYVTAQKSDYTFETITILPVTANQFHKDIVGTYNVQSGNISVDKTTLDFGKVIENQNSEIKSFIITNETANLLSIQLTVPAGFSISNFTGGDISANTSQQVDVVFQPNSIAQFQGDLEIKLSGITVGTVNLVGEGIAQLGNCEYSDVPDRATDAATYLCGQGLLDNDGIAEGSYILNRAALAKLAYLSIDLDENPSVEYVKQFPSPFNDLQIEITDKNAPFYNSWFYTYAKVLYHLEYQDGELALERKRLNFQPERPVTHQQLVKILLETWDIKPDATPNLLFADQDLISEEYRGYISKAAQLGVISGNDAQNFFNPKDNAVRADAFVMLHRLMLDNDSLKPNPVYEDFFIPGNYKTNTLHSPGNVAEGNFPWAETSFYIPGVGLSLSFTHSYNSFLGELPNEIFKLKPLGKLWSHTYNCYLWKEEGDGTTSNDTWVVYWPNGSYHIYKKKNGVFECQNSGVHDQFTEISPNKYEIKTKNQIVYTFEKPDGTNDEFPNVLTSIKDRNDNQITLLYEMSEAAGDWRRLRKVQGTAGRVLTFSYHSGTDLVKEVKDPINRIIYFDYSQPSGRYSNSNSELISYKNAEGNTTQYNYYSDPQNKNLLKTITLPKGNTITNEYENRKLRSTQNQIDGSAVNIVPDPNNYKQSKEYKTKVFTNNEEINKIYDENRNLREISSSESGTITITPHTINTNMPGQITGTDGVVWQYDYDDQDNITKVKLPALSLEHIYEYNTLNDLIKYTDPEKHFPVEYIYENGNLKEITGYRGNTQIVRKPNGLVEKVTNPENISVSFDYDDFWNLTEVKAPLGIVNKSTYDAIGRLKTTTNPNKETSQFGYNNLDFVTYVTNPLGYITEYGFDKNGNNKTITNANGGTTALEYEFETDLLKNKIFGDDTTSYNYLNDGRLENYTTPNGKTITFDYDDEERVKSNGYADFTYYEENNLIKTVTKKNGTPITYEYDVLHRIESITYDEQTVGYRYDLNSNLKKIIYPDGKEVDYTFYPDNLLKTVEDWNGNTTTYTYRNDGSLNTITYPNGIITSYSYDDAGRLTGITTTCNSGILLNYRFALDPVGRHLKENYDGIVDLPYTLPNKTIESKYDETNRILYAGNTYFSFDNNGNMKQKGETQLVFDDFDQLLSYTSTENQFVYEYDGLRNRRKRIANGETNKYILDILGMSRVIMETDENSTPKNYYVYGLGLISRTSATDETRYYHSDFRGSTIAMTDASQTITHKYKYDPFGEVLASEEEDFNPFRYVGNYGVMYEDSTLFFMRARYYDVENGRFISEDPLWNENLFSYVENSPINYIDVDGRFIKKVSTLIGKGLKRPKTYEDIGDSYELYSNLKFVDNIYTAEDEELIREYEKFLAGIAGGEIGACVGGALGGPPGALIGAIVGDFIGERIIENNSPEAIKRRQEISEQNQRAVRILNSGSMGEIYFMQRVFGRY